MTAIIVIGLALVGLWAHYMSTQTNPEVKKLRKMMNR